MVGSIGNKEKVTINDTTAYWVHSMTVVRGTVMNLSAVERKQNKLVDAFR